MAAIGNATTAVAAQVVAPQQPAATTHPVLERVKAVLAETSGTLVDPKFSDLVIGYLGDRCLDWTQRPEALRTKITEAFCKVNKDTESKWGLYNGSDEYVMLQTQDNNLVEAIIRNAPKTQKEFWFLDIGAGNFDWGRWRKWFLKDHLARPWPLNCCQQKQSWLPRDIKINIVGIRGEQNSESKAAQLADNIRVYNIGSFRVEDLHQEFQRVFGYSLEGRIDLIVTHWCFRHLVDPVGTFVQAYNLLRPGSGLFFFDGFFFLPEQETIGNVNPVKTMITLLEETQAPFLMQKHDSCRSLPHFVVRRPSSEPCRLLMNYFSSDHMPWGYQVGSGQVTRFTKPYQDAAQSGKFFRWKRGDTTVYGDKPLFDWLMTHNVFWKGWKGNEPPAWDPLTLAVKEEK
jgi:SAM-dependent methyltransferase